MKVSLKRILRLKWKYAIGEILLIVIGVLIALFLNNLNEFRKERIFEKKIINELQISLKTDLENHIKTRLERSKSIEESSNIVLDYLNKNIKYNDSLKHHFWKLNWIMIFEPKMTAFETLKAKGIDKLSNDLLRQKLLNLYDYSYPQVDFFLKDYNNWIIDKVEPFCLKNFEIELSSNGKEYDPVNREELTTNVEFKNLVVQGKTNSKTIISRLEFLVDQIEEVLAIIEEL